MSQKSWDKTRHVRAPPVPPEPTVALPASTAAPRAREVFGQAIGFVFRWINNHIWSGEFFIAASIGAYGIGVAAMYEKQYNIAAIFYFASIAYGAARVMRWEDARADLGKVQRRIASAVVIVTAAAMFGLSYWWIGHTRAQRELESRSVTVPLNKDSASKSEVFLNPGEHPCERMIMIPIPSDQHTTLISEQLMPPTCDDDSAHSTVVKGATIDFANTGSSTDHNIRVNIEFGNFLVKSVKCAARIEILEGPTGGDWSGVLYLVARELFPGESHSCNADFVNGIETPTVQSWLDRFGFVKGASELHDIIDVYTYRINFGALEKVTGGPRPYKRDMTIYPK
jgi:hypothetical protein